MTEHPMTDQTRVHPGTVTEVSEGKHQRTKTRTRGYRNGKVHEVRVLPGVWAQAQQILNSDHGYTQITINSETEVTVR